jgi:hypothetical protein
MKWLPVDGSVQHGIGANGRRYSVVQANSEDYVAYQLALGIAIGEDLGSRKSEEGARGLCEDRERDLEALRRQA